MSVLFSDNFDDNDVTDWTDDFGTWSASGGKANFTVAPSNRHYQSTGTLPSTFWLSLKLTLLSSGLNLTGDHKPYTGIAASGDYKRRYIAIGIDRTGGVNYPRLYYNDDTAGDFDANLTSYAVAADTEYTFTARVTLVTGSNGIVQVWLDGGGYSHELIHNVSTVDNNHYTPNQAITGTDYSDGTAGTATLDDFIVGETESDVYTAPSGATHDPMDFDVR